MQLNHNSFVKLETKQGLENREFVHLHSVRHKEIGWGFDTLGCLSFYWVRVVEGKLEENVMFVERVEIGGKVQE